MKILHRITGKTLWDIERGENIRKICTVENVNKWVLREKLSETSTSAKWMKKGQSEWHEINHYMKE